MRHKAFHVVNVHKSLGIVSDLILSQMGDKLRKRVHLYSHFDEFKAIEKKHLPKEYGGIVPMKEMIGKCTGVVFPGHFIINICLINRTIKERTSRKARFLPTLL